MQTITFDNGPEFSDHAALARDLNARVYFAHPYVAWERGVNENTNGLIRHYFPKDRDLRRVGKPYLAPVMDSLNHRPRKTLGLPTPYEVFFHTNTALPAALTS